MATLSKHGEIGQIERVAHKVAYCQDGQILRNDGDGWKVWKRLKAGFVPAESFARAQAKYAERIANNPAFAEWRSLMHELVSFRHRAIVLTAISMMPQDPDGVWSTMDDYSSLGVELSIEDCVALCRAYEAATVEAREKAALTAEPVAALV